ncbi:hypothetical protein IMY05_013G0036400 [Salix suchowensis]|nr:hypothetical protein IMY05_013G0036400 [Salix suchowensis]
MSVTKMAGICSLNPTTLMTLKSQTRTKTPQILKLAVSGVTELLRVFSFSAKRGTKLYSRNLKLLVPFFDCPSIGLQNIEKVNILYKLKIDFTVNKKTA